MKKRICDRCGNLSLLLKSKGSASLCPTCIVEIIPEIKRAKKNRPVDVLTIAREHFKKTHAGGNYFLRNIPADLLAKIKKKMHDDKIYQRDVMLDALEAYFK